MLIKVEILQEDCSVYSNMPPNSKLEVLSDTLYKKEPVDCIAKRLGNFITRERNVAPILRL